MSHNALLVSIMYVGFVWSYLSPSSWFAYPVCIQIQWRRFFWTEVKSLLDMLLCLLSSILCLYRYIVKGNKGAIYCLYIWWNALFYGLFDLCNSLGSVVLVEIIGFNGLRLKKFQHKSHSYWVPTKYKINLFQYLN